MHDENSNSNGKSVEVISLHQRRRNYACKKRYEIVKRNCVGRARAKSIERITCIQLGEWDCSHEYWPWEPSENYLNNLEFNKYCRELTLPLCWCENGLYIPATPEEVEDHRKTNINPTMTGVAEANNSNQRIFENNLEVDRGTRVNVDLIEPYPDYPEIEDGEDEY